MKTKSKAEREAAPIKIAKDAIVVVVSAQAIEGKL